MRRQRTPYTPRDAEDRGAAVAEEWPDAAGRHAAARAGGDPVAADGAARPGTRRCSRTQRGRPLSGQVQHYYWHPIRCAFGNPSLDLYELRHFCASYMLNDLDLHAEDVAAQLGHTDGGVLVQRLYGHPSTELARKRAHEAHRRPIVLPLRAAKDLSNG